MVRTSDDAIFDYLQRIGRERLQAKKPVLADEC